MYMIQVISREIVSDFEIAGKRFIANAVAGEVFNIKASSLIGWPWPESPFKAVLNCGTTIENTSLGLGELSTEGKKL